MANLLTVEIKLTGVMFDPTKTPLIIEAAVRDGLTVATDLIARTGSGLAPANTGALRQSIAGTVVPMGVGHWQGVVSSPLAYAPVMEFGRRPAARQPPSDAIALWARRKLGLSAAEAERAAYPIARAIGRRGIAAKRFLQRARDRHRATVDRIFAAVAERIAREWTR
jgi:hypothetical protein